MKQQPRVIADRPPRFWPLALATSVVTALALVPVYRLWEATLGVPFNYAGDGNSHALVVKAVLDHGWYERNPNLGAPFVQHFSDYPLADNLHLVVMRVMGLGGASYPTVINVYFLLGYVLVALAATWVLRRFGISRGVALVVGVLYAFLPFHQTRGEGHLFLGAYYVVPLACYLVIASLDRAPLLPFGRRSQAGERRRWRTWANAGVVAMCVLIGSTGPYFAIFTLLLLAFAFVVQIVQREGIARPASTIAMAGMIAITLGLNMAPDVLYRARHGNNPAIAHRRVSDSEEYGLKLSAMLLPKEHHRVDLLRRVTAKFHDGSVIQGEDGQSLGLTGAAGLILLLSLAVLEPIRRRRKAAHPVQERLQQLSTLTVGLFIVATVSGLSSIIALVVQEVRAWNRASVFVGFFALFAVALVLDEARRWARLPPWVRRATPALLTLLLVVGIADQTSSPKPYGPTKREFASDDMFVRSIERVVGKQARVFQLPYNPFPEYPGAVKMAYYDELRGYLHSSTLRWSYGAMRGRPDGEWQDLLTKQPTSEVLDTVAALGFSAIYVDRFGYEDRGVAIEREIAAVASGAPLVSPNHRLVLYDIRGYARAQRAADPTRVHTLRSTVLRLSPDRD